MLGSCGKQRRKMVVDRKIPWWNQLVAEDWLRRLLDVMLDMGGGGGDLNITDLEAYTMTSEEAINAKFEAFEIHMEEKMRSLFAEFSMGRPPSPKKLQQGETSDQ
ncbi:hypothetical protein GW17_00038020 [Ensete ventricosum]|nr:hypothetical protein GW17_00038020 [Ensete ventricosum]